MRTRIIIGCLALFVGAGIASAESAWTLLAKGIKHYQKGDYEKAERVLTSAVRLNGKCGDAYYYLGMMSEKKRQNTKAAELYRQIGEEFPTYGLGQERLGHMARRAGKLDVALKHYQVAAEKRPSANAWMMVGNVELDLKKYKEAEVSLGKADGFSKNNLDLLELWGRLYMETERYAEALAKYRQMVKTIPSDTTARFLVAQCLDLLGRTKEAKTELRAVLKRDPYNGRALRLAIRLHKDDPSMEKVVEEYQKRLVRLEKTPPRVRRVKGGDSKK